MSEALLSRSRVASDDSAHGAIIELADVSKHYQLRRTSLRQPPPTLKAVDRVSLAVEKGKTLGVVGESGCGKTTLSRLILRREAPTSGTVLFEGQDLWKLGAARLRDYHRQVSAVFQDPFASLNPRHRVTEIVTEPIMVNLRMGRHDRQSRLRELLSDVGLPADAASFYPHEFSGGQRQRIAIARAIALDPRLVVLDEPVSALDVSIRAQILNLLRDLQERNRVAYLFIAHDLAAVQHMSDEIVVMYLGSVVEHASAADLYSRPLHPYTRALLAVSAPPDPRNRNLDPPLSGEVPSPVDPPSGCRFRTRCPIAVARCADETPELRQLEPGHTVACHLAS